MKALSVAVIAVLIGVGGPPILNNYTLDNIVMVNGRTIVGTLGPTPKPIGPTPRPIGPTPKPTPPSPR